MTFSLLQDKKEEPKLPLPPSNWNTSITDQTVALQNFVDSAKKDKQQENPTANILTCDDLELSLSKTVIKSFIFSIFE